MKKYWLISKLLAAMVSMFFEGRWLDGVTLPVLYCSWMEKCREMKRGLP